MTHLDINKLLNAEERMTREGGEKLRKLILHHWKPREIITLDFKDKPIASVSFWDESIAKLQEEGWTKKQIDERIELKAIHSRDLEIIRKLIDYRQN